MIRTIGSVPEGQPNSRTFAIVNDRSRLSTDGTFGRALRARGSCRPGEQAAGPGLIVSPGTDQAWQVRGDLIESRFEHYSRLHAVGERVELAIAEPDAGTAHALVVEIPVALRLKPGDCEALRDGVEDLRRAASTLDALGDALDTVPGIDVETT